MIQLSDHFSYRRLLRFTLPSIVMLIFTSIYSVVDGFFVSNFAGKTPFAAVNFIMPVLMIPGCIGFMFGTGGSALISRTMGEGDGRKANEIFSLLICVSALCGVVLALLGILLLRPIASTLGATGALLDDSVRYGRIILAALPFYLLQNEFQCLFITAEKPNLGLYVTIASGVTNMVLDALFVAAFSWGLTGAALATAISQLIGGVIPLICFRRGNNCRLRFVPFSFDGRAIWKICTNGVSELLSNISMSLVGTLYNIQLIRYAGEDGIAAYGVLMYVSMIFQAIFIGYAVGIAPVVSYHWGASHADELKNLLKKSFALLAVFSAVMFVAGELLGSPMAALFVGYDAELSAMTVHAFTVFSLTYLISGFSIFASSFFTALNDGVISAIISFLRTMVFQLAAILIFPRIWQLEGIWLSNVAAELMAVMVSLLLLYRKRNRYHYL